MPKINPEIETFARIKVVGVGGSGCHALSRMVSAKIEGVEFIAVNTDVQDLHNSNAPTKIHIGKNLTRGLGAGMNPEIGRQAAEENRDEIQEAMKAADMLSAQGLSTTVADARFAKPLDTELVERLARDHEVLLTIEEGSVGGFGAFVLHHLAGCGRLDSGLKVRTLTLPDLFIDQAKPEEMYEQAGLDARSIAASAIAALGRGDVSALKVVAG